MEYTGNIFVGGDAHIAPLIIKIQGHAIRTCFGRLIVFKFWDDVSIVPY